MKKPIIQSILWAFVLIWMLLIFWLSSQPAAESSALSGNVIRRVVELVRPDFLSLPAKQQAAMIAAWQHGARKAAHVLIYLVLGALCMAALLRQKKQRRPAFALAIVICLLYAVSDELHQFYVDGRGAQISDVGIDACGSFAGITLVWLAHYLRTSRLRPGRECS